MGDEEVEKLEAEVNEMAEKISEYRSSLPDKLTSTLSSFLVAQRPVLETRFDVGSEHGPSSVSSLDVEKPVLSSTTALLAQEDTECAQKIELLKEKLANNALAIPNVLTRMKECVSRIDKLESHNRIIHPVFKRKRTG